MIIELDCISQYPIPEDATGIAARIPKRIFQKKLFLIENLQIEQYVDSKGTIKKKFTTGKYDNEFYKLNYPYTELKEKYYTPLKIKGFGNA